MNKKFLTLVVIGSIISLATYFGLSFYKPYHKEELAHAQGVTLDQVFSDAPLSEPAAEAAPAEEAPAEPVAEAAPVEEAAASTEEATPAETAPAEEVPVVVPEPELAAEPVEEPTPAPAPVEPKPAPKKPAPAKKAESGVWWPKEDASKLSLKLATSASDQKAIALLFNGEFDSASSANANIQVLDAKGGKVSSDWQISAKNKHLLFASMPATGRYTVVIKAGLKDSGGRALGKDLRGPVQVK